MKRLIALLGILLGASSFAQNNNGLVTPSIDPAGDSVALAKLRVKMNAIRKKRPTVAVVLAGGGAKGASHVGVLKYLEEQGIPIDMIGGTSMGGLVAGLYSLGHSADRLRNIFLDADWNVVLRDKTSLDYYSWEQRQKKSTYPLTIPFSFKDKNYESLASSLPDGGVYGFNIYNILNALSVDYQNEMDFCDLPIPFYCVATEVNTMKERNIFSGVLSDAIRSSIAIPLYFKPVRKDNGEILLDGGMRNNFPVDIALAAGADIVIGVDLRTETGSLDHAGQLIMQTLFGIGNDAYNATKNLPSVYIHPDMTGYWTMSFGKEEIADIVQRGYDAAKGCEAQIKQVKKALGNFKMPARKKATDLYSTKIHVENICYEGLDGREMDYIRDKILIRPDNEIGAKDIDVALSTIYSTGAFKSVKCRVLGKDGHYTLLFECQKGPKHTLSITGRGDSEQILALQLNAGFWNNTVSGFKADVTFKIANSPKTTVDFAYLPIRGPKIGLLASSEFGNVRQFRIFYQDEDDPVHGIFNFWHHNVELYLQDSHWSQVHLKCGARVQGTSRIDDRLDLSYFGEVNFNSKDNEEFPTKGWEIYGAVDRVFNQYALLTNETTSSEYWAWTKHRAVYSTLRARVPISFSDRLALLLSAQARDISVDFFGTNEQAGENTSKYRSNIIGGYYDKNYFDQQIRFFGINGAMYCYNKLVVSDAEFRVRFGKKHYVSLLGGAWVEGDRWDELDMPCWAVGLQYAIPTPVGKFSINGHYNSLLKKFEAYASIGYRF